MPTRVVTTQLQVQMYQQMNAPVAGYMIQFFNDGTAGATTANKIRTDCRTQSSHSSAVHQMLTECKCCSEYHEWKQNTVKKHKSCK